MTSAIRGFFEAMFSFPRKVKDEVWPTSFDRLVQRYFVPIADRGGFKLRKLRKGIFEIDGRDFSMCIREGTGHSRDFSVTLVPPESRREDPDSARREFGLGVIAEFRGEPLPDRDMFTPGRLKRGFAEAALSAEKFLVPYLSGARRDIDDIRQFVEEKIEASGLRTKKYRFHPNVREEWL